MKGGKGGLSRGEKLFRKISQGEKFKNEIEKIRDTFKVSPASYSYNQFKPLIETQEKSNAFRKEIDQILKRSAVPINKWWRRRLITFVLSDDQKDFLPPLWDFEMPFMELVNHHVGRDGSYNDIRFYEGVSQKDVREFMIRNWKYMMPSYRVGTTQRIRAQSKSEIEINKRAVELMKLPKKELGPFPKEIEVARRLSKEFDRKITDVKERVRRTKGKHR